MDHHGGADGHGIRPAVRARVRRDSARDLRPFAAHRSRTRRHCDPARVRAAPACAQQRVPAPGHAGGAFVRSAALHASVAGNQTVCQRRTARSPAGTCGSCPYESPTPPGGGTLVDCLWPRGAHQHGRVSAARYLRYVQRRDQQGAADHSLYVVATRARGLPGRGAHRYRQLQREGHRRQGHFRRSAERRPIGRSARLRSV